MLHKLLFSLYVWPLEEIIIRIRFGPDGNLKSPNSSNIVCLRSESWTAATETPLIPFSRDMRDWERRNNDDMTMVVVHKNNLIACWEKRLCHMTSYGGNNGPVVLAFMTSHRLVSILILLVTRRTNPLFSCVSTARHKSG